MIGVCVCGGGGGVVRGEGGGGRFTSLASLEVYIFWSFSWILLILCLILGTGLKFNAAPSPSLH